eukprot:scaffold6087_cov96-Skeletonema_marinoi.AAC.4
MEQVPFLRPLRRDERSASCQHLPSIYWINLDVSKERRNVLVKSMESSGIVDQHRVAAYDTKQTTVEGKEKCPCEVYGIVGNS